MVAASSGTATLGTALQFTVTALDASNEVFSGYTGTIHFTSGDSKASLPPDTGLAGGTRTFLATFYSVGDLPATGSFRQTIGSLATARQWHAANLLQDGKVLVTGGMVDNSGTATAITELYDPTTEMFTATTGSLTTARALQTAILSV